MRAALDSCKTIIVDLEDSMGDKLYRANAIIQAQKVYPDHDFFCKCEFNYQPIISMIPEIRIFHSYEKHGLNKAECAVIQMPAKTLARNIGDKFPAPTRYGFYLNLDYTPYNLKLKLPENFNDQFEDLKKRIHWQTNNINVICQLRTKNFDGRSWSVANITELARLLKSEDDFDIYTIGEKHDMLYPGKDIINLCGSTSWLETIFLLKNSNINFVIDSACLHLCKAIDAPYIAFWGLTDPQDVIDRAPEHYDLGWSLTDRSSPSQKITPLQAFKEAGFEPEQTLIHSLIKIRDYSQNGEQDIIEKYFNENPPKYKTIVDVGAYGAEMSNSLALMKTGWFGLLIEANPARMPIIKQDFSGLNYDLINVAMGPVTGSKTYYLHKVPGHNSFIHDRYPDTLTGKTRQILMQKLGDVLTEKIIPIDFDYLSIDTEGMDFLIMQQLFTETEFRPRLIVSEITSYQDAEAFYTAAGYSILHITKDNKWGNVIAARK
jgi:FkbM family methyltransferase